MLTIVDTYKSFSCLWIGNRSIGQQVRLGKSFPGDVPLYFTIFLKILKSKTQRHMAVLGIECFYMVLLSKAILFKSLKTRFSSLSPSWVKPLQLKMSSRCYQLRKWTIKWQLLRQVDNSFHLIVFRWTSETRISSNTWGRTISLNVW